MRITRLSRQRNHQKPQQQPPPSQPSPLPKPIIPQDFLAYRLSSISRAKLRQECSKPEHDLRRFLGNAAVNRASVDWVHRDLMRRVDEVGSEIEVLHLEAV